jgi:hypothetical protein
VRLPHCNAGYSPHGMSVAASGKYYRLSDPDRRTGGLPLERRVRPMS